MSKRRDTSRMGKQALVREAARRKHAGEYARMNERRTAPKRVKRVAEAEQPRYLAERTRAILRRLAHLALAPLSLVRAVAERFRERQLRES